MMTATAFRYNGGKIYCHQERTAKAHNRYECYWGCDSRDSNKLFNEQPLPLEDLE